MTRKHSNTTPKRGYPAQRGGWTLVELLVAVAVMMATTTLIAQLLSSSRNHWSNVSGQQQALFAADAVLRQLSLLPFEELTENSPTITDLRQEVSRKLPQADLQVTVTPGEAGAINSKHITAEISWPVATEPQPRSVQLETWAYAGPVVTDAEESEPEESADAAATPEASADTSTAEPAVAGEDNTADETDGDETEGDEATAASSPQPEEERR